MKIDEVVEQAREIPDATTTIDWEARFRTSNCSRLSLVVDSLLFHFKKASFKWKRSVALLASRKFARRAKRQRKRLERSVDSCDNSLMLELGAQLSSIVPKVSMFTSLRSAPGRLCLGRRKGLLDLDDAVLLKLARQMDGRSLFHFARVCRRIRNVVLANIASLPKVKSAMHDMYIDFNKHTGLEDARVLKCGRSVGATSHTGRSIRKLLPPMLCCQLRIHFGNNVQVINWIPKIYCSYKENRLRPIAFIFGGGTFDEALDRNRPTGADLRSFSEKEFIALVSLFIPHLKEVQLATTRLFRIKTLPFFLFSMIDLVSIFGMTYEQLPVRCDVDDVCRIICLWRHSFRSHSCEVYIREPQGFDKVNWMQYGTLETDQANRVKAVKVKHKSHRGVMLILRFH